MGIPLNVRCSVSVCAKVIDEIIAQHSNKIIFSWLYVLKISRILSWIYRNNKPLVGIDSPLHLPHSTIVLVEENECEHVFVE